MTSFNLTCIGSIIIKYQIIAGRCDIAEVMRTARLTILFTSQASEIVAKIVSSIAHLALGRVFATITVSYVGTRNALSSSQIVVIWASCTILFDVAIDTGRTNARNQIKALGTAGAG